MPNGNDGEDSERISKAFLDVELKGLNSSLPKERRPLSELLSETSPSFITLSGDQIRFNLSELQSISKLVSPGRLDAIRLPIVIMKEAGTKRGVYTVAGNDYELSLLARLLVKDSLDKFIFRPDILELGTHYPTIFVLGFSF